jgi:hypothetical protein
MRFQQKATITAQNTFTGWVNITGLFHITISGLTDSTVTMQRSEDGGTTPIDVQPFVPATGNGFFTDAMPANDFIWRIGVKTGDYGSDTVNVEIGG